MFELAPQQPALLDGTCPIQLIICEGAVAAGTRVRVHVEACSGGGEQVRSGRSGWRAWIAQIVVCSWLFRYLRVAECTIQCCRLFRCFCETRGFERYKFKEMLQVFVVCLKTKRF